MSTHEIPVIKIDKIEKHPNADSLGIVTVFGWSCCVKLGEYQPGDLVAYIPPDYVCDTRRKEFNFLDNGKGNWQHRIRVKKLRGIYSQGLLIKAPEGLNEGDNAMEALEIFRYEPPEPLTTFGDQEKGPSNIVAYKYDVESYYRYPELFKENEDVIVTEKIHGANARYVWSSAANRMYCGSRTNWKKKSDNILWWKALKQNTWIEEWCKNNPDDVLYGEVFGQVQNLKYGANQNQIFFVAFDILKKGQWMNFEEAYDSIAKFDGQWAPIVGQYKFSKELIKIADGLDSKWPSANHMAEGVVIRPIKERIDPELGRVQLKIVSNRYLMKQK